MTRYTATITHHSIARARVIDAGNDLPSARKKAVEEFGGEFLDYQIVIMDRDMPWEQRAADDNRMGIVDSKRVGARTWRHPDKRKGNR